MKLSGRTRCSLEINVNLTPYSNQANYNCSGLISGWVDTSRGGSGRGRDECKLQREPRDECKESQTSLEAFCAKLNIIKNIFNKYF